MTAENRPRAKFGPTHEERIEVLAKMAADLAGIGANGPMTLRLGDEVLYDGPAWQHPDFLDRAACALEALRGGAPR